MGPTTPPVPGACAHGPSPWAPAHLSEGLAHQGGQTLSPLLTCPSADVPIAMTFTLVAGPCVIESAELVFAIAEQLQAIGGRLGIDPIFKASFDKANRSAGSSYR